MEVNHKVPFIKCNNNNFKVIKLFLESFGYKPYGILCYKSFNEFYIILIGDTYSLTYSNSDIVNTYKQDKSKHEVTNIEEFLYEAAKIAGKEYKRKDIVTTNDLVGDISNFPIEIVQKMVDYQVKQGNMPNVAVFQKNCAAAKSQSGFDWNNTDEGNNFWCDVIYLDNFDLFFKKYPKKEQKAMNEFAKKDLIPGKHIVRFNNGIIGIVICDESNNKYIHTKDDYMLLDDFTDNLIFQPNARWTIDAVYTLHTPIYIFENTQFEIESFFNPVWERKRTIKIKDIFDKFDIKNNEMSIEMPNGNKIDIKVG